MSLVLLEELEVVSAMLPLVFAVLIASLLAFNGDLVFCELLVSILPMVLFLTLCFCKHNNGSPQKIPITHIRLTYTQSDTTSVS